MELLAAQQAALFRLQSGSLFGSLAGPLSQRLITPESSTPIGSALANHNATSTGSVESNTPSSSDSNSTTSPTSGSTPVIPVSTAVQAVLPVSSPISNSVAASALLQSRVGIPTPTLPTGSLPVPALSSPASQLPNSPGIQNIKDLLLLQQQQLAQQAQFQQQLAHQQSFQLAQAAAQEQTLTTPARAAAAPYPTINPLMLRGAYPAQGNF